MRARRVAIALAAVALVPVVATEEACTKPLTVQVQGTNGVVRSTEPGRTCAEDGKGSYRHFGAESTLASGALGNLDGDARATLDVHYDGPAALTRGGPNAFLLGSESHVTLSNQRGTVQILLRKGDCTAAAVNFDGNTAATPAPGTWAATDVVGTGAFRNSSGG